MKKRYKLFGGYLPLFVLALIASSIMRTVALFNDFDKKTGYFTSKTLITVTDLIVVGAAVLLFTYIFAARSGLRLIPDFTCPASYAPTGIVGAALIFVGIHFFSAAGRSADRIAELKDFGSSSAQSLIATERILLILSVIVGVLALLSAVHFALCALIEKSISFGRADFGIITVAFLAVYVVYLYFDNDLPINSPGKILNQISFLFAAVFFLYETRLSIGREKWRAYVAFGFISALLSAYSSIPSLIYYFAEGTEIAGSVYEMVLAAALFIFVTARILLTGDLIEDTVSPFAVAFGMASDARSAEIAPQVKDPEPEEEEAETVDENQLTIDDALAREDNEKKVDEEQISLEIALAVGSDGEIAAEIESAVEAEEASRDKDGSEIGTNDAEAPIAGAEEAISSPDDLTKNTEEESADESGASENK